SAEGGAPEGEGDHAVLAGLAAASEVVEPAPEPGDPFEDEVEFDSSFPLGPDDLKVEGDLEPGDLDTLDYAAVFGPVRGSIHDPPRDPPRPRRRARLAYEDDLFLDDTEEEEGARYPVTPVKARGRRRELVVLGIAAGVMIAIGVGS